MSEITLDSLKYIKTIKQTTHKSTSEYRIKTSSSIRDKFIVKKVTLPIKDIKAHLLLQQIHLIKDIKEVNFIKNVSIDNN